MTRTIVICMMVIFTHVSADDILAAKANLDNGRYHERYTGNLKKAAQYYAAALNHKKADAEIKARANLGLAACAVRDGRTEQALKLITHALKDRPKHLTAMLDAHRFNPKAVQDPRTLPFKPTSPESKELRRRCEKMIIPKLSAVEEPVSKLFAKINEQVMKLDPKKKGFNFIVVLRPEHVPVTEDLDGLEGDGFDFDDEEGDIGLDGDGLEGEKTEKDPEPTVTMDFDNIPLDQAIRYVCEQYNLTYKFRDDSIMILGPNVTTDEIKLRFFKVDPNMFMRERWNSMADRDMFDDDDDAEFNFEKFLGNMGVKYPTAMNGSIASLCFDRGTNQLVARNTAENLKLIDLILKGSIPVSPQAKFDTILWEVTADANVLSKVPRSELPAFIDALPETMRNRISSSTISSSSKTMGSARRCGLGEIFGKKAYLSHCLLAMTEIRTDSVTMDVNLTWSLRAWEPGSAPVDESRATRPPLWSATLKKGLSFWDGRRVAFEIAPANPKQKHGTLYLVVQASIVDPAGVSIRKSLESKNGRL